MDSAEASASISRRDFFAIAAAAGVVVYGSGRAIAAEDGPYGPFHMGIQSYSLRGYNTDEALAKTVELGLSWWEAFPDHLPVTDDPAVIAGYKRKLADHRIRLASYGVVEFSNDEADARRKFEFARAMGLRTMSAHPQPDSFALLDKLVEEYRINLGIHNHGPGDELYARVDQVLAAIKGHSPRIGACDDTGHYLRSGEDPVKAARRFGPRLYGVHLKDVRIGPNGNREFTEIGKGLLDTVALLRVLKNTNYERRGIISLEYEDHAEAPMPYIQECLAATRDAVKRM
ncbi:MAG TPA: sugar phosphate isomerase/epimerase [Chthonomonadales bacterium]|nr:sugar phosphate isomerase/epimerase [Chthonomonadales bacterium]